MFHRLALSPSMLLVILAVTTICLLTKSFIVALLHRQEVHLSQTGVEVYAFDNRTDGNRTVNDFSFVINSSINVEVLGVRGRYSIEIQPFPEFKREESHILHGLRLTEKRGWWSLNGDLNCLQHPVHLLKPGSQPKPGAFVSFPGSGNTWLRTLLMGITGLFIGSVYEDTFHSNGKPRQSIIIIAKMTTPHCLDKQQANISYRLPSDCNCWLLQKTHDFSLYDNPGRLPLANARTLQKFEGKGILLIRNPFKAIQSYLNFVHGGMTDLAPKSAFEGKGWDDFVRYSVLSWELLATVWIKGLKQGGVVYYENLYYNTSFELIRTLKMIGFNNYDKERFDCGIRHAYHNSFQRKTSVSESPYTEKQKLLIQQSIGNVQLALKERGLDPLPVHYYMT